MGSPAGNSYRENLARGTTASPPLQPPRGDGGEHRLHLQAFFWPKPRRLGDITCTFSGAGQLMRHTVTDTLGVLVHS